MSKRKLNKVGEFNKPMQTITEWNEFCKGIKILILSGDWDGEETEFVEMIGKHDELKKQDPKEIFMKVRTRFGTELLLQPGDPQFMIVEKKIAQQPDKN
jgi:hypothetical protein